MNLLSDRGKLLGNRDEALKKSWHEAAIGSHANAALAKCAYARSMSFSAISAKALATGESAYCSR